MGTGSIVDRRVLIAVDGSAASLDALRAGTRMADPFDDRRIVVTS